MSYNNPSLEYIAGLFDGEGSVMLTKNKMRKDNTISYALWVQVDMVNKFIPTFLYTRYGGTLKKYPPVGIRQEHWKWITAASYALAFLRDIKPFTIVKLPQILIGIQFQEGREGRGNYVSEENKGVEEQLRHLMRILNDKGGE